jgi:short-subunit dehydrogenase
MKRFDFKDKIVLVTGASTGIGRYSALEFAGRGAHLALSARSVDKLETLKTEIEQMGQKAWVLPADLSQGGEAARLIERTIETCGRIDVLLNNAGIGYSEIVPDLDIKKARQLFEIDFWAVVEGTKKVLPHMLRQEGGQKAIVNVSSIAGKRAFPASSLYNSAKFALEAFSEALRVETLQTDIRVVTICPTVTETPFFEHPFVKDSAMHDNTRLVKAQPVEHVARKLVDAVYRGRRDVHFSFPGWLVVRLNPLFPGLFDRIAFNMKGEKVANRYEEIQSGAEVKNI